MPTNDEQYYQVFRPGGITPIQATSFEEAAEEWAELVQDMIVQGDKKKENNWATDLVGKTLDVSIGLVQSGETRVFEVSIKSRTTDLSDEAAFFEGPQQTVKRGG